MNRSIFIIPLLLFSCTSSPDSSTEDNEAISNSLPASRAHVEVYDNGQVRIKGRMMGENRDGVWVSFYENGVKWSEENYYDGKLNGVSVNYYPSGIIRYRGSYIEDEKVGMWQFYSEDGILAKEVDFSTK